MRKKLILICDDDEQQYGNLKAICEDAGYEVARSFHWENVAEDVKKHARVHLLILDLQFDNEYVGHKSIPELVRAFPNLKIVVYSQLLVDKDRLEDAQRVFNEVKQYQNVVSLLGPLNGPSEIREAIDRALHTSVWLHDHELWLLHVSDTQFGGSGVLGGPAYLAESITKAAERFVEDSPHADEGGRRKLPGIVVCTGDLAQRARPDEFALAGTFLEKLGGACLDGRHDLRGVMEGQNTIVVPGNHDVNWDALRAQNVHVIEETGSSGEQGTRKCEYCDGLVHRRAELEFVREYGWLPFCRCPFGLPKGHAAWAWKPGYYVWNLSKELGVLFVCVNSSRWGVDHIESSGRVHRDIWRRIRDELNSLDPTKSALRVLIIHHSLDYNAEPSNRLRLPDAEDEPRQLIEELGEECRFAIAMTGHLHESCVNELDTGTKERKLIHIGAGTARSGDRKTYREPEFNIVRLDELSPESNKFERVTVYPFMWNANIFAQKNAFELGRRAFASFALRY